MTPGDLVTVRGLRGLFRVKGIYRDGSVTCYGPLTASGRPGPRSRWRAFVPADVRVTEHTEAEG